MLNASSLLSGRTVSLSSFTASWRSVRVPLQFRNRHLHSRQSATCYSNVAASMSSSAGGSEGIHTRAAAVLKYWLGDDYATQALTAFPQDKPKIWFMGGPAVDQEVASKFGEDVERAARGEYRSWTQGYNGLAAVIIMDQFTRNVFRGSPKTYALDEEALALAKRIEAEGSASGFPAIHRAWLYMPLMHSERVEDLQECVDRFQTLKQEVEQLPGSEAVGGVLAYNVKYAKEHLDVVAKWGRFPHRNKLLGRPDTPEEEAGLADGSIPKW